MSRKKCYALYEVEPSYYEIVAVSNSLSSLKFILFLRFHENFIKKLLFVRGRATRDWFDKRSKFYDYESFLTAAKEYSPLNGWKPNAHRYKVPKHRHSLLKQYASGEYGIKTEDILGLYDYGGYARISKSWKDQSKRKHQWCRNT